MTIAEIKVKMLNDKAILPTQGSAAAAGYDLYAVEDATILPYSTALIGTGLAFELPENTYLALHARSGLAIKEGLRLANCVGIIDSDYRGELKVAIYNDSNETKTIKNGERIAQAILQEYIQMSFTRVDKLNESERGKGGFGSTGK